MRVMICQAPKCGKEFTAYYAQGLPRKYCSRTCGSRADYWRHRKARLYAKHLDYVLRKDHYDAKGKLDRLLNREARNACSAAWHKANPERSRQRGIRRYSRKSNLNTTIRLSEVEWSVILAAWNYRCAYCGTKPERLSQDHIVPLSRGGSHTADNVVPACMPCNQKKNTKSLEQFLRERVA